MIDYRTPRFEERVDCVDLVLDLVGGETQDRSWAVLKPGGMLVSTVQDPAEAAARRQARGSFFMVRSDVGQLASIGSLIAAGQGLAARRGHLHAGRGAGGAVPGWRKAMSAASWS